LASGFNKSTNSPFAIAKPWLFAAENPTLCLFEIKVMFLSRVGITSAVLSLEALSTIIIS
jgi:hypothetical protein